MDNYGPHISALQRINLQNENIIIHFFPDHGSDQMQPLDIEIFGLMKRYMHNFRNDMRYSILTNQICKIYNALFKICIPRNCKAALKLIGIDSDVVCNITVPNLVFHLTEEKKWKLKQTQLIH